MKALVTVWLKELTDLVRDRRTLAIALLMGPLLMPALMLGMGKLVTSRISDQMEKPSVWRSSTSSMSSAFDSSAVRRAMSASDMPCRRPK